MARPEVYALLTDPRHHAAWIRDLKRVVPRADGRDQWVMHGPVGSMVWDVEQTVARAPASLAWAMRGVEGAGYMRFDLADQGSGTAITIKRFLGFRQIPASRSLEHWWGEPAERLRGDVSHLAELIRAGPGPQINAVGFRATGAGISRGL